MNSKTITDTQIKNNIPYWVKFSKQNGKIKGISSSPIQDFDDSERVIESINPVCRDLLKGKANRRNYAVLWDPVKNIWEVDVKSSTLVIKPLSDRLAPVTTEKNPFSTDIHITISKLSGAVKLTANLKQIAKHLNLSSIQQIVSDDTGLIDLYFTRKNDPDYLIQVLSVNAEELIVNRETITYIDIKFLDTIDWTDVSLYTKPIFKMYSMEFLESNVEIKSTQLHGQISRATYKNNTNDTDINIYVVNDKVMIKSNLTHQQLYYFKGKKTFPIYISDNEIDNYITTLKLNTLDLCHNTITELDKPWYWPDEPFITYKHPKLRINYHNGEQQ